MLASFNYYNPPAVILLLGFVGVLGLHVVIFCKVRHAGLGALVGAAGGAIIAAVVFGSGSGDMRGLMTPVFAMIFGAMGLLTGAIVGWMGRRTKSEDDTNPPR